MRAAHGRLAWPKYTIYLHTYLVILQASSRKILEEHHKEIYDCVCNLKNSEKPTCTEIRENIYSSLCKVTNTVRQEPKECTGSYEYVSKKPRRVNRKWEEITAAFGILSDTTDSSLLESGIPDKI